MADFKELDALLQSFVDGGLPGCAMMIAKRGETLYENYFGFADAETKKSVSKDSIFRMASMSKLPLYITCMMLFERGKFLMSDPIYNFFPEWRNVKKFVYQPDGTLSAVPTDGPVTVRDALSMKCGLPYCNAPHPTDEPTDASMQRAIKPLWDRGYFTLREHIRAMSEAVLAFEPGTHWRYGFSSELAAGLIEEVCGKPIDDVFKELLFDPLSMNETRSRFFGDIPERMVKLYAVRADGALKPGPGSFDKKHLPGAENEKGWARLFSNCSDYTKLMQMLANGGEYRGVRIMGRKTIDLMRANGLNEIQQRDFETDSAPYNYGYGYGYGVRTLTDKYKGGHNGSLGAFGWTGGFGSWCEADPEEGVSIVYMHNLMPNMEKFYHPRMRAAAYGCLK